jgi:4-amino-4-deoxy-L-arabinose transferase-like glycosyltransferase
MPARRSASVTEAALFLLLFAFLAALHLLQLDADPPGAVQRHFLTDEGWWSHNARLHYLFGTWSPDEHNVALVWAPLFTGALRLVFGLSGEGLVQLRLLSVASGLATCVAVFGFVRAWHGPRAAFLATFLLGTHFFTLTHHRIGYPETFQAFFVTGALLCTVAAAHRPVWAVGAGLSFACALLAKISALWVAAPIAVFWLVHHRAAGDASWPCFRWSAPILFVASAAAVGGAVGIFLVLPNTELFAAALERRIGIAGGGNPLRGLAQLGLHHAFPVAEIEASGFVRQSPVLLLCSLLALLGRATGATAGRSAPLPAMAWCWLLVGLVLIGTEELAPDRRFLQLTPALCILVAICLLEGRIALPARTRGDRTYSRGAVGAALGVGVLLGLGLRGGLAEWAHTSLGVGAGSASLLAWIGFTAGAVVLLPPLSRILPRRPVALSSALVLAAFLALNVGRFGWALAHPHYTVRDACARVASLTSDWPAGERAILGDAADTVALGSGQFAFLIRRWERRGIFMNLDGWERFDPWLVLGEAPERPGFEPLPDLELAPGAGDVPRFRIPMYLRRESAPAHAQ